MITIHLIIQYILSDNKKPANHLGVTNVSVTTIKINKISNCISEKNFYIKNKRDCKRECKRIRKSKRIRKRKVKIIKTRRDT